jgi:hypothetical protein
MSNPNYPGVGLLATTVEKYAKTMEEQIFNSKVLLWALKAAGRIQNEDGGTSITQPLIYAANPNTGSYADYDVFSTAAMTGISAANFPWKQYYGLLHISGIEMAQNSGVSAILNLLEARIKQLELSMADQINQQLFNDGNGNSQKDFYGIAAIVSATDPTWGDLGNIDRTANAYWRANTQTASTADTLTVADMINVYNDASKGNDHPGIVITTQTAFETYEGLLTDNIRYEDTKMGDAGFQNLMFKGAPVTFDEDAAVATSTEGDAPVWFLNLQYITLKTLAGVWFKPSDMSQPINQDAFYKHILCYGNLVVSNCARQGCLYNVHA